MTEPAAAAATPLPIGVQEKLLALKDALLTQNPQYASILNTLHAETKGHPEYVYALSDEELQTIFSGYEKFSNLKILEGTPKEKGVSKKVGASLSLDDI